MHTKCSHRLPLFEVHEDCMSQQGDVFDSKFIPLHCTELKVCPLTLTPVEGGESIFKTLKYPNLKWFEAFHGLIITEF